MPDLSLTAWLLAGASVILVGIAKTGVPGIAILGVSIMAMVMPTRVSVGFILPLLIVGDIFALIYYRRHAQWSRLWRLFPWVLAGLACGAFILSRLNDAALRPLLGGIVLGLLVLEGCRQRFAWQEMPQSPWFTAVSGLLAGVATAVGNVAGPIMGIYLISQGHRKHQFMGTTAWFFFIVNMSKVPIFAGLGIITLESLTMDAMLAPLVIVGALTGRRILEHIPQRVFNAAVLSLAAVAAVRLLLG